MDSVGGADVASVLDAVEDGLVAVDEAGRVTFANAAACRMLGRSNGELPGLALASVPAVDADGEPVAPEAQPVARTLLDGHDVVGMLLGLGSGDDRRWYQVGSVPLRDRLSHRMTGAVATYRDVTATRLERDALERRALADPLTGLANRTLLRDRLTQALARVRRRGGGAALLLVDVDHFKAINDTYGHQAGDAVLAELGRRLTGLARAEDTVSRQGGEEFAVLLEQVADTEEAAAVARRLRIDFSRPIHLPDDLGTVTTTVSVGVAVTGELTADPSALYRDADVALYRAKEEGRDRYVVFDEGLRAWTAERSDWRRRVSEAFLAGRLSVRARPAVDLRSGEGRGASVVAVLPATQSAPATDLMPQLAADAALAADLDTWLVERALALDDVGPVEVQLSARTLLHPDTPQRLARLVAAAGRDPGWLGVGIGERELMEHPRGVRVAVDALRSQGLRIVLLDVRGDRVPLRRLASLPLDRVWLADPLVREAAGDGRASATARAVTRLFEDLGEPVGASGLDDLAAVELARSLGCELGSGAAVS